MISKEHVIELDQKFTNKYEFFEQVAIIAKKMGFVKKEKHSYDAMCEREEQASTGFVDGIAIPHGKSKKIINPAILIFKTHPIPWDGCLDGSDIEVSIVLLIPVKGTDHLKNLSKISSMLIHQEYKNLLKTASVDEIIRYTNKGLNA